MLHDPEWPTLEQCRRHSRLTMLYKIYNRLVDTDFTSQLTLTQSSTRGHASRFLQPQCSCAAYSNLFLPHTIRDWNALATDPLLFQTVDAFKNYLFTDPSSQHFRFQLDYFLSAGNVTYPAAVRLSSLRSHTLDGR